MKKVILALAALTTFGLAFTACGGDDEPASKTEKFLPAPASSDLSVRVDADDNGQPNGFIDETTGDNTGIVTVETTEEGKVGIGVLPSSPLNRDVASLSGVEKKDINALLTILFFDATLTGNTYQLGSYGTIIIIRDGMKFKFILNLFGCEYTFTAIPKEKLPASDRTTSLCRDWKVKSCQVQTKVSGATIGKNFNGCNLNEIEAWLIGKGVQISPKDQLPAKSNILLLSFTRSGSYMIKYENEKIDAADWWWANESQGSLKYTWRGEDMGNAYEAGACIAKFYDGNCELTIEALIHGSDGNDYPSKVVAILAD